MQDSTQQPTPEATETPRGRRLYRSLGDRRIAGVCGGVAAYLGVDSFLVRVLWVVSCFVGFVGVLGYLAAWMIIPESSGGAAEPRPAPMSPANRNYVLGIILLVFGVILLADRQGFDFLVPWHWSDYVPNWLNWGVVFSLIIILGGIALIMRQRKPPSVETTSVAAPIEQPKEPESTTSKRLTRSLDERMIGGVCGGIAKYFSIDPSLVRVGWVLMTISGVVFLGVVAYIVAMIVVPEEMRIDDSPPEGSAAET